MDRSRSLITRGKTGLKRCAVLWGLSLRALWLSLWLHSVSKVLTTGIGVRLLPKTARAVRALADRQRLLAREWSGVDIPAMYAPLPAGHTGAALRSGVADKSNQLWRDWRWTRLDPLIGGPLVFARTR
jgi:hypothetical protein